MAPINKNWTDADGNHAGGQSIGNNFTIAWQRGPLNEAGRNGAFLIEVLGACLDWVRIPYQSHICAYGFGFTIIFGVRDIPEAIRMKTLQEVLEACLSQVDYYQSQERFSCDENQQSIDSLKFAIECLPDVEAALVHITIAHAALVMRRDRREKDGTLGTHIGEAGNDAE
jgi:hypothetical protein